MTRSIENRSAGCRVYALMMNARNAARLVGCVLPWLVGCGSTGGSESASAVAPKQVSGVSSIEANHGIEVGRLQPLVEGELRVLTFNINYGVGHDPRNTAIVAEIDADLVLLQETTAESEATFRETLGGQYPHILFRECCNAGGLGVLSKYPITDETYIEPNVGWFPAWRVVVDTPLGAVQALNVHLRPPMSDSGSWVRGYFSTRSVRGEEMADLWQAMGGTMPTVVAGDFNENADGQAIAFLAEHGLRSALPQVRPRAKTWHWQTKVGKIRAMLDHVVYSRGLVLRSAEVIDGGFSDHFPVVAVLSVAP